MTNGQILILSIVLSLAFSGALAFIPANIAKKKGKNFGLWWFYGWMIFIVALIHSLLLPDLNAQVMKNTATSADALLKYKELLNSGLITQEEFDAKKKQLLNL